MAASKCVMGLAWLVQGRKTFVLRPRSVSPSEQLKRERGRAPVSTYVSGRNKISAWPTMGEDCGGHLRRELVDKAGVYQGLEAKRRNHHLLLHPYYLQRGISEMHAPKDVQGVRTSSTWILASL